MKRKALKIITIIFTSLGLILFLLSTYYFFVVIKQVADTPSTGEPNYGGIVLLFLGIIWVGLIFLDFILNIVGVTLSSIDFAKTNKEKGNVAFPAVFLGLNLAMLVLNIFFFLV